MKFQEIILALQQFWSEQGCILAEPYDVEKGAGTMNPSTFLRVLGPGQSAPENRHVATAAANVIASLDALQATCPNLERVAVVVAPWSAATDEANSAGPWTEPA